jgi:hypothetical protein
MKWVLLVWIHSSAVSDKSNMALGVVRGFSTQQECMQAGKQAQGMTEFATTWRTSEAVTFVCVAQERR